MPADLTLWRVVHLLVSFVEDSIATSGLFHYLYTLNKNYDAANMSASLPGNRDLPASQYDLSTYWGRVKQSAQISDPR